VCVCVCVCVCCGCLFAAAVVVVVVAVVVGKERFTTYISFLTHKMCAWVVGYISQAK
jgi:hypothetical protein